MPDGSREGSFLSRFLRLVLLWAAIGLVIWSFGRVGLRTWRNWRDRAEIDKELVVLHWSGEGGPEENAIVEKSLRAFEAAHPGIRVRRLNPGDAGSFYTKLQTMLAAGDPPDLFYVGAERVASFVDMGLLEPLDPYLQADAKAAAPEAIDLAGFFPSTVAAFKHDGTRMGHGTLYGVPKDFTTVGFYYNKDLFRKAGVPFPKDDWTWDQYIAAARAIGTMKDAAGESYVGSEFVTWPMMVRAYLRTEGAEVRGRDFDDLTIESPATQAALDRLRGWRQDETNTLTSGRSKLASGAAAFVTGRVGMAGPFGRWVVPEYRRIRDFDWDYAPLPRGARQANVIATVAWAMSARSENKPEAWQLLRWLVSPDMQAANARLGLALPTIRSVAESDAFLDASQKPSNNRGFLDPAPTAEVVDWPSDPRFEQLLAGNLDRALLVGDQSVAEATRGFLAEWTAEKDSPLAKPGFPAFPWRPVTWVLSLLAAAVVVWMVRMASARREGRAETSEARWGWLLASPWLLGFALFMAFPIVMSLLLSLAKWKGVSTLDTATLVGGGNYLQLLGHDPRFMTSLKVTLYYTLIAVPGGQALALLAAVLMNQKIGGIHFFRAAWYLPSVLAGVGVAVLWRWIFDTDGGLMNMALRPLLGLFGGSPPDWFGKDAATWGAPAFAIMGFWTVGGGMMIYLAGLQAVPEELLEAARIDRLGAFARFFRVTLPMLSPVILFNLIMSIIGSFQVFTQAFVMTGGGPGDLTRFYVLNLYNQAFEFYEMGYASAMAWILLLITLGLTMLTLRGSRGLVHYEGLKR
ncbi:MAG: extracellular solute-binding protein [Planctomycetes bacterium]|nr:extracellular solute-binding protein [Planctomycetota bacterium]